MVIALFCLIIRGADALLVESRMLLLPDNAVATRSAPR